jgi:hypothetical protein
MKSTTEPFGFGPSSLDSISPELLPENRQLPKIRPDVLEQPDAIQSFKNGSMIAPQSQGWEAQ